MPKNVTGNFDVHQSNGFTVHIDVIDQAEDGRLTGEASRDGQTGPIFFHDAFATDDEITFLLTAEDAEGPDPVARYTGRFDFAGRLTGISFDVRNPNTQGTWIVDTLF